MAILAIASMAGFYQMRHVNKFKAALARSQAVDVIELATRELLEQSDVIKTTVAKSSRSALKRCFAGQGCQAPNEGAPLRVRRYGVNMYLPGQSAPFAGSRVGFDKNGAPCNLQTPTRNPRDCVPVYRIVTDLLVGCQGACRSPAHVATQFFIQVRRERLESGQACAERRRWPGWCTLRSDTVDRIVGGEFSLDGMTLECPVNQVLRAIGVQGEPICISINDLEYEGATSGNNVVVDIKPMDCRTLNAGADEQHYVNGYNQQGIIDCKRGTW